MDTQVLLRGMSFLGNPSLCLYRRPSIASFLTHAIHSRTGTILTTMPRSLQAPPPSLSCDDSAHHSYPTHLLPIFVDLLAGAMVRAGARVRFELGSPMLPFDQLLCVLPPDGLHLLPPSYRALATSPSSPLAPYFPPQVRIDAEGTRASWEAVVLVPFVEWERVWECVREANERSALSEEERRRNAFGPSWTFHYLEPSPSSRSPAYHYPSSLPHVWPDLVECHVQRQPLGSCTPQTRK